MEFRLSKYVAIDARNYDKAIAFYRDTLGWQVIETSEAETQFKKGDATFFVATMPIALIPPTLNTKWMI